MQTSEHIDQIAMALAAAQAEIQNPAKDATNPHFKSTYADLPSGLKAIRPALSKHGIAVLQMTRMDGECMYLDTRLAHKSGQWIGSSYYVARFPVKHQEAGSALTYARRYALFALVGIAGDDDDDDGNAASTDRTPAPDNDGRSPAFDAAIETALAITNKVDLRSWFAKQKPALTSMLGKREFSDIEAAVKTHAATLPETEHKEAAE